MVTKKLLGTIDVDAGLVYIVDPCYIKHHQLVTDPEKWGDFCDAFYKDRNGRSFAEMCGGVVANTRNGDGSFGVYGIYDKGGELMRIEIDFMKMVG